MYQNKYIVPIIAANHNGNGDENLFSNSLEYDSFVNLYNLPESYGSDPDTYFIENNMKYLHCTHAYTYDFELRNLNLESLTTVENSKSNIKFWLNYVLKSFTWGRYGLPNVLKNQTLLKYLEYNWEAHEEIIRSHSYLPILIDPQSSTHQEYYDMNFKVPDSARFRIAALFDLIESENIQFVFWKKFNHNYIYGQENQNPIQIYSNISYPVFDKLKNSIINYDSTSDSFTEQRIPVSLDQITFCNNRSFYNVSSSLRKNIFSDLIISQGLDISFVKDSPNETTYLDLIQNNSQKRFDVIKLPSWKTISSDDEIAISSYTKSQCIKRQTSLIGFLNTFECLISSEEKKDFNSFNLVSFAPASDLTTSSRALRKITKLIESLLWEDGVKIYDPQKLQNIYAKLFQGLNKYSDFCFQAMPQEHIENIFQTNVSEITVFDSVKNQILTAEPAVNLSIKNKYEKINSLYTQNLESIANSNFRETITNTNYSFKNYKDNYERLVRLKSLVSEGINDLSTFIKDIYSSANFIKSNKSLHASVANKYFEAYNKSLEEQNYSLNGFFNNLAEDKISISYIEYDLGSKHNRISFNSDSKEVLDFIKLKNLNPLFQILELGFIVDKPVKIKIDSKEKYVVGGPYKIKCTKSDIHVSLLRKESLFGVNISNNNNNSYAVHPHTTTFSNPSNLFNFTRGCLGEASSLLYKAFEKNDLKLIILSAMTWVSSANSSDPWGKKYHWFPKLSDLKDYVEPQADSETDVTQQDVNSFLTSVFDENDSNDIPEIQVEENQQTQTNAQETWNPNTFSDQPETYVPAFTQNINS